MQSQSIQQVVVAEQEQVDLIKSSKKVEEEWKSERDKPTTQQSHNRYFVFVAVVIHYLFRFDNTGRIVSVAVAISNQTCIVFKTD